MSLPGKVNLSDVGTLILSGASVAFLIKVAGAGSKYLAEVLYAQWLGPEQYGIYAYGIGWAQLLAVVAALGFPNTVLRFVPVYLLDKKKALLKGIALRSQQIPVVVGLALFAVALLVLRVEESLLDEYGAALLVGMGCVPLIALMNTQSAVIKATKRVGLALISPMLLWPLMGLGLTYVLLRTWNGPGGLVALSAIAVAIALLCVFQSGAITYVLGKEVWQTATASNDRLWFATALPLLIVAGFQIVLSRTDIIMTGAILGAEEVGLYNAAARTGGLISFMLTAFNAIGAPMISEYWSTGGTDRLEQTVVFIIRWTFWSSLALVIGMFFTGEIVLSLFGDDFVAAYWALMIVALGHLVNACAGPVGYLMALTGYERVAAKVYGITALINIPLNYTLILHVGLEGAAISTAITMGMWNMWLSYEAKNRTGVNIFSSLRKAILFR